MRKFQAMYNFATETETKMSYKIWKKVSSERCRDMMYNARTNAKKQCGGNIKDAGDENPAWISKDFWRELIKQWSPSEYKKVLDSGSRNRKWVLNLTMLVVQSLMPLTKGSWYVSF